GVSEGDLVIVSGNGRRRHVFEVNGSYRWAPEADSVGDYQHQRAAVLTPHDPEVIWKHSGNRVAKDQNLRWTFARCSALVRADGSEQESEIYSEGARFEILATAVERDPAARAAAIKHHGTRCLACQLSFAEQYGDIGTGFIHVHHL